MRPRLAPPAQALEALPQPVVAVVGGRVDLEQRLEGLARPLRLPGVVERPAERLEDRAAPGLEPGGALEDDRRLGVMPAVEQLVSALEEVVGVVGSSMTRESWHERGATRSSGASRAVRAAIRRRPQPSR